MSKPTPLRAMILRLAAWSMVSALRFSPPASRASKPSSFARVSSSSQPGWGMPDLDGEAGALNKLAGLALALKLDLDAGQDAGLSHLFLFFY